MLFNELFIKEIEENPIFGLKKACAITLEKLEEFESYNNSNWSEEEHELLWEGATFIALAIENFDISIDVNVVEPSGDISYNCNSLRDYITNVDSQLQSRATLLKIESYTNKYENIFNNNFSYEFSQGDLDRIQVLINELREQITTFKDFEQKHRQRLLKRLEKLQSELHKKVSDLDIFWGLIGDAGVVIGKFGTDAKPMVDRIKEIGQIAWNTQSRTEELPSNSKNPLLGVDSELL